MARCGDCNKFVSIESDDPEVNDLNVETQDTVDRATTATVSGTVRLVQQCQECGTELAEAEVEIEEDVSLTHDDSCACIQEKENEDDDDPPEVELEAEEESVEATDKMVKRKHMYGADIEVKVHCTECQASQTVTIHVEEASNSFQDC